MPPLNSSETRSKLSAAVVAALNARTSAPSDPPLSVSFQNLPKPSLLSHAGGFEKTNPPLPPRQLAAARLLARGRSVNEVATELGVSRQTVGTWKRSVEFQEEVMRLHEMLARG